MADAGKRVFTAERYKKRRSFSMSVAKPTPAPPMAPPQLVPRMRQ